jgi:hypothetical protein
MSHTTLSFYRRDGRSGHILSPFFRAYDRIVDNAREAILCEDYFAAAHVMKDVERATAEARAILREARNG